MEANYLQLIYIRKESDYDNHKHKTEAILNGKYNIKQKDNGKIVDANFRWQYKDLVACL